MKSRITIEVDFENGNTPVIQILQTASDDVRDKLLLHFTQQLGGSSWCQIKWQEYGVTGADGQLNRIFITPIQPYQLKEQAEIMLKQASLNADVKFNEIIAPVTESLDFQRSEYPTR